MWRERKPHGLAYAVPVAVVVQREGRVALSEVEDERLRLAQEKVGFRLRAIRFDLYKARQTRHQQR